MGQPEKETAIADYVAQGGRDFENVPASPVVQAAACRQCNAHRGSACLVKGQPWGGKVAPRLHTKRVKDYLAGVSPQVEENTETSEEVPMVATIRERIIVDLDSLHPNPWQPRVYMDPERLEEIAASIRQQGLLSIPRVRAHNRAGEYQLAFGHQRVESCRMIAADGAPVEDWPVGQIEVEVGGDDRPADGRDRPHRERTPVGRAPAGPRARPPAGDRRDGVAGQ